ncbi:MAG: 2-C-methyl-D-erythritol 2,4-cyclodiphosphate synthase [Peptococcaceae bacterium]|nr:2-C-methyl-D-erythritol 2,4-cyclodiphosphate synthase [Peptococcaceae bacterium]
MRIGFGYDVHRLKTGCKLVLGGVYLVYEKGLEGHSDADVLTHAIIDALLGAAGMGDIGRHFPDTKQEYKNIDSLILLADVREKIKLAGYKIVNIDSTIVAQAPKLSGHIEDMEKNLSIALQLDCTLVNVKATTTEGLGFTGIGEGMAAYAVALIDSL